MVDRLVLASQGGWHSSSARYRLGPLVRYDFCPIEALPAGSFPSPAQINSLLERGGHGAVLVLQRVLPSRVDLARLREAYDHLVFDIDDAIYAVPPDLSRHWALKLPKRATRLVLRGSAHASARKRRLERTLRAVDICVVGNAVLAEFARRFAPSVIEIPTTVAPVSNPPAARPNPPVIVWMGLPDNLQYLKIVRRTLEYLKREINFGFRIVSSQTWEDAPVDVEFISWSADAAREALLSSSIGLAPLTDDAWTRGKCAFRAIQYGGHALPTVASPVGITDRVILHQTTGLLARDEAEWITALRLLLTNPDLIDVMGVAALDHIKNAYSNDTSIERWRKLLNSL